jgi:polysaccharide pyruvyl transferase WcaK-like protein
MTASKNENQKSLGLIGLYRCGNLGDEAIWLAFAKTLPGMMPAGWAIKLVTFGPGGFDVAAIPNDSQQAETLLHEKALDDPNARRLDLMYWGAGGGRKFFSRLAKFDALWYAGGHWIHDLSLTTAAGVAAPMVWAQRKKINNGFVNVGAGPIKTAMGRLVARAGTKGSGPLVVRDKHSQKVLESAGVKKPAVVGADAAFLLDPATKGMDAVCAEMNWPVDKPVVGIVPCAWFKMDDLYKRNNSAIGSMIDALARQVRDLDAQGFAVALIPTMLPEDETTCRQIRQKANAGFVVPTRKTTARQLMALIGRCRALISFRMHPVLFAYVTGTPFVAMNYADKLQSLVECVGLDRWLVDLAFDWPKNLSATFRQLLDTPDPFADAVPLDQMRAQAIAGIQAAIETLTEAGR